MSMTVQHRGTDLLDKSVEVILSNQSESGAYLASPAFENYQFCWLRDGSFIGYSMLISGNADSCRRFLEWTDRVIVRHRDRMESAPAGVGRRVAPARYTLDGRAADDDWPNFQIDGYGSWLWLLAEYVDRTGEKILLHRFQESLRLTISYLASVWTLPNSDCWEENPADIHTSTLACVYAGLNAINRHLTERELHELAEQVRAKALELTADGRFCKSSADQDVDASLLWLSIPFRLVEPGDPIMRQTVRTIEERLLVDGGVKRYREDTYYGGGLWILLTCWLGWYYTEIGKAEKAVSLIDWVEAHASPGGTLPEQVSESVNDPAQTGPWIEKWGKIADPLLWSHAMYIILRHAIGERP